MIKELEGASKCLVKTVGKLSWRWERASSE